MPRGGDRSAQTRANGKGVGRPPKPKAISLKAKLIGQELLRARLRKWGFGVAEVEAQLEIQEGRCALCAELLTEGWVIDHDHMTMQFRGLIHVRCNNLLGLAKDDPRRLEQAIAYLRKHNQFLRE